MGFHLVVEGAAAIILVIAGGFFVIASWRARTEGAAGPPMQVGRAATATLVGVPLGGIIFIILLILLANTMGNPPRQDHGHHGSVPHRDASGWNVA